MRRLLVRRQKLPDLKVFSCPEGSACLGEEGERMEDYVQRVPREQSQNQLGVEDDVVKEEQR